MDRRDILSHDTRVHVLYRYTVHGYTVDDHSFFLLSIFPVKTYGKPESFLKI